MKALRYRYRNATGMEYLDRLIGEDGINTDVKVDIPSRVFITGGIVIFAAIVGSVIVVKAINKKK